MVGGGGGVELLCILGDREAAIVGTSAAIVLRGEDKCDKGGKIWLTEDLLSLLPVALPSLLATNAL